jgi:HK97 family phage major capsid protein
MAGYPLLTSTLVPTDLGAGNDKTALVLGDWSELIIAYWSELDILVNPYESTAYAKGNVQVRAMATCDVAVRHPEAFAAAVDI